MPRNAQWRLVARPQGLFKPEDFRWVEEDTPPLADGDALVRTEYLSLDPTNRGWAAGDTYLPAVPLDGVMRGFGVGRVVESRAPGIAPGDAVSGLLGWQRYAVMAAASLARLPDVPLPIEAHLGLLGHIGLTAWVGLLEIGRPQPGETLVVSAAAGAVGSLVGQIAKTLGLRIVHILASRLKEKFHRPVIAFAEGHEGELKGSGRSIPGLHLRDAIDLVSKREPELIKKFGGHAMAAGLTIDSTHLPRFRECFETVCSELLTPALLTRVIETDGALKASEASLELAQLMRTEVWGQAFPDPSFQGEFKVAQQRVVGEKHLKLRLAQDGLSFEAMLFFHADPLPDRVLAVYRLDVNEYNGNTSLQLLLSHWEPA